MKPPIRRRLRIHGQARPESATERAAKIAVKYIQHSPYYSYILQMIREGTSNKDLAEWGIEHGWFDVNMKTVISYLQYFKRQSPTLIRPVTPEYETGSEIKGYDYLFDGNAAAMSIETELLKLIKLQKARHAIDFHSERSIGKLFNTSNKEVQVLAELMMHYAKLKGMTGADMNVQVSGHYDENVRSDLQGIHHEERQRAVLTAVAAKLAEQISAS